MKPLHQVRQALSGMRLHDLSVGADGRNRCLLSAFGSVTGRNQPSNSRGANPAARVPKIKVPKQPVRFLDEHEVPRVLAAVPLRWQAMFATAVYTGARKGELVGLRAEDVDLARGLVRLSRSYDGPTKSSKPRSAPIPPELEPYLRDALDHASGGYLFPTLDGRMLPRDTDLVEVLRRAMVHAGSSSGRRPSRRGCASTISGRRSARTPTRPPATCASSRRSSDTATRD